MAKKRILVIDDDRGIVKGIKKILEEQNYKVVTAEDGKEGLEKVKSEKPDLIVLDVMMPKMGGFEVCSTLKNDVHYNKIPIIIVSDMAHHDALEVGKDVGADAYLAKPFEPIILITKIKELLKKLLLNKSRDIFRKKEKLLGEMFLEKGLVNKNQVQAVIQEQKQLTNKKLIGEMFLEKGLVTEDDLFMTLAEQYDIEFIKLANIDIDWKAPLGLSSSFITNNECIPLRVDEETIMLIIANPLDEWTLDMAEKEAAPNKLKVVLTKKSDLDAAINEYHRNYMKEELNVLVVDDDQGARKLFIQALKEYNVITAENGTQAIDLAKEHTFDIAFIDMRMPGLNGCETFIELKKIQPDITGIIITQYSDEDLRVKSFLAGTARYLKKPINIGELRKLVLHEANIRGKVKKSGDV